MNRHSAPDDADGGSLARFVYALIAGIVAIDLVWAARIGLSISGGWLPIGVAVALLLLSRAYRTRSRGIAATAQGGACWVLFSVSGLVLTYLSATTALPLQDAALARIDHAVGFDWVTVRAWIDGAPPVKAVLAFAYAMLLPQIVLAILYFPAVVLARRNTELFAAAATTLIVTCAVSALWPALGALALARPNDAIHLHDLLLLRGAGPWHFQLQVMRGIVTMPSFHAVLAVLFIHAFRATGWIGWTITSINLVMLVSAVPIGGHYIADVAAGAGLALAAIALVRHWPRYAAADAHDPAPADALAG